VTRPASAQSPKRFIISRRCGQLANRLVLFANIIALAEETGGRMNNVTFHSYAEHFKTTRRDIYCRYPVPQRRSLFDLIPGAAWFIRKTRIFFHLVRAAASAQRKHRIFGSRAITLKEELGQTEVISLETAAFHAQINQAKTVFICGWKFRAPEYVKRHAEKIRRNFQPVEELEQAAHKVPERLRQQADVLVGVHVRQGDYRQFKGGIFFFEPARYAEWMREMAEQFPGRKVAFFVCSDEPRRAEEFPGLTVDFGGHSPVADLYGLAQCDYIFGPSSTFSQWAAFYGDKPLLQFYNAETRLKLADFRKTYLLEIP